MSVDVAFHTSVKEKGESTAGRLSESFLPKELSRLSGKTVFQLHIAEIIRSQVYRAPSKSFFKMVDLGRQVGERLI